MVSSQGEPTTPTNQKKITGISTRRKGKGKSKGKGKERKGKGEVEKELDLYEKW